MYLPQHFEEMRAEELHRVIREYPLGVLVVNPKFPEKLGRFAL
jgi:transcriptional regulator